MINYLTCIFLLFFPSINFAQNIQDILDKIPREDRKALEYIFYRLMKSDNFSYTLFGDKPVSLSGDFTLTPCGNILTGHRCGGVFWKNWKIWERYQNKFKIKDYLFIKEPSLNCPNVVNVVFINKKCFVEKVNQHIDIFRNKLSNDLTGENLLVQIEKNQKFSPIIKNDEMLWGILLGYGLHNAKLYCKREKLEQFISIEDFPKIPEKKPIPTENFSSIEEECEYLNSKLRPFGERHYLPLISNSIFFVADPEHAETKALEKKYRELRGRISAIYAKGDFLEITLSKLTATD